ncbi:MAG: penicillin acylase family protein, partial [Pseudomonadota bacterium]|nr:penicillin acylase family protein [Pseudomonadota bacterium]
MTRWLKRGALVLLLLAVIAAVTAWALMRASLPTLSGDRPLIGLSAPATVQRDALGVVTIDADNEMDAMRALGYIHAQERYFEMDLMRRTAAGELAELFGSAAIDTDKKHRIHRMRARVTERLDAIAGNKILQLEAYT